jgi:hypothetical protein
MVIPPVQYPDLIKIINREYTDGLDRILSAQIDEEDRIVAYAQDGFKRIRCEISDTQIRFRLLGAGESVEFAEQPDPIDPILTQLKPIGDATFTEWFITLQSLMQDSDNLTEFRDRLTDSYPDLNAGEFKQAMLDASVVAGMRGYDDAANTEDSTEFKAFGDECLDMLVTALLDRYTSDSLQLDALVQIL